MRISLHTKAERSTMSRTRATTTIAALAAVAAMTLAACSSTEAAPEESADAAPATVTIEDNHGSVEVPVNPETVVALDNHVFETLSSWDIPLAAAPKGVMGEGLWPEYMEESVLDVGNHREPNLEMIVAAQPDLIIAGYRFSESYDDIVAQNPDAVVIELAPREGEEIGSELVRLTEALGQIFDREDEAAEIVADYEDSLAAASEAYDGSSTVMTLMASGGELSYIAPVNGRSLGMLYPTLDLVPAIEQDGSTDHMGDDINVEAIVAANPDWIVLMDREGAMQSTAEGYVPPAELVEGSEALQSVTAVQEGNVIYTSPSFYLTEDIQTYTATYQQLADAFAGA